MVDVDVKIEEQREEPFKHPLYITGPRERLAEVPAPVALLQWKGGPCVDAHCLCGEQHHRCHTEFMYHLRCHRCGRIYYVDDAIRLVEMTPAELASMEARGVRSILPMEGDEHDGDDAVCPDCGRRPCVCLCSRKRLEAAVDALSKIYRLVRRPEGGASRALEEIKVLAEAVLAVCS